MPDKSKWQERQTTLRESDGRIVPQQREDQSRETKLGNASAGKAAKLTRASDRASTVHSDGQSVLTRLDRITKRAEDGHTATFNNLYTLLTYDLLWLAFRKLKRDKAPGVDGVTVDQYEEKLQENLLDLETRLHRQSYRPHPSLRRDIPKGDGKTRPLGIACVEDKIVQRFQAVLPKRLARFSLKLAEEKTKLLRFGRFARRDCQRLGEGAPSTFDFLGFTHYCGTSRAGRFQLKRRTAKKKFKAKVRDLKTWLHHHLTTPLSEVWTTMNAKLRGHYQYYGINDNWPWLMKFRGMAKRLAFRWLNRRSQSRSMNWPEFYTYVDRHELAGPRRLTDLIAMSRGM